MKLDANNVLKEALELSPGREELAGHLFDSLEQEVDEDAQASWQADIDRRLCDLDSGRVEPISWCEAPRNLSRTQGHLNIR